MLAMEEMMIEIARDLDEDLDHGRHADMIHTKVEEMTEEIEIEGTTDQIETDQTARNETINSPEATRTKNNNNKHQRDHQLQSYHPRR